MMRDILIKLVDQQDVGLITLGLIALVIICYCIQLTQKHQYWKRCGVAHIKPLPLVGNILKVILFKLSSAELYQDMYFKFPNKRLFGAYEFYQPVVIVRDTKLIESILIKDFQYFTDHARFTDEKGLFAYGLFQLCGNAWRSVRYKVNRAFAVARVKDMFDDILNCTTDMLEEIKKNQNKDYEIREPLAAFTIRVLTNAVLGIKIMNQKNRAEFIKMNSTIFDTTPVRFLNLIGILQFPKLANLLGFTFMSKESTDFYINLIRNIFKHRENFQHQRNDFTQQLMKLKHQGFIEMQFKDKEDDYLDLVNAVSTENVEFTEELLIGQAFQIFGAGFDPVLVTMLSTLFELARFPIIQQRAREDIIKVLQKHNNQYTYESIKDMTYLEQCIQETLRFHPIAPLLFRCCTKDYYIPEENIVIFKGQKVIIPVNGLQMDPKYYPEPEVFKPERFPPNTLKENFTYLPFGDGPRICIGTKLAMVFLKITLSKLLSNYKFALSPKAEIPFAENKQSIVMLPKGKMLFNVTSV